MKSKVHKLDIDKLVPVSVHLSKLSDAIKNGDVKKDVYNAKIKNIEDKMPSITNLDITVVPTTIVNEIRNVRDLVKKSRLRCKNIRNRK